MQMARIRGAAPDLGNPVHRSRPALLPRHHAKRTLEPAAALGEADRCAKLAP
jgi:hypothetical protein